MTAESDPQDRKQLAIAARESLRLAALLVLASGWSNARFKPEWYAALGDAADSASMTRDELAALLEVESRTISNWRRAGKNCEATVSKHPPRVETTQALSSATLKHLESIVDLLHDWHRTLRPAAEHPRRISPGPRYESIVEMLSTLQSAADRLTSIGKRSRHHRRTSSRAKALLVSRPGDREKAPEFPRREERPRRRSDCATGPRPCPWVSCKHHLYLDVNPNTGSIKLNFPDLEPWELAETCALDSAERGGLTLEEVGEVLNLTRERIRQVEVRGLLKLKLVNT